MEKPQRDPASPAEDFIKQGQMKPASFLGDFFYFLKNNKKWWMLPLIALLLGYGLLVLLGSTGAAPFIYTLF